MTPELQARYQSIRMRLAAGEKVPDDEYIEALKSWRGGRVTAAAQSDKARVAKSQKVILNGDDLMRELTEGL